MNSSSSSFGPACACTFDADAMRDGVGGIGAGIVVVADSER